VAGVPAAPAAADFPPPPHITLFAPLHTICPHIAAMGYCLFLSSPERVVEPGGAPPWQVFAQTGVLPFAMKACWGFAIAPGLAASLASVLVFLSWEQLAG